MRTLTPKEARILTDAAMLPVDAEVNYGPDYEADAHSLIGRGYLALMGMCDTSLSLAITAQGLLALRCQAALERGL